MSPTSSATWLIPTSLAGPSPRLSSGLLDTYLAIVSRREGRQYAERRLPEDVAHRILDAGRLAGSATNRQPWTFYVLEDRNLVERVAETLFATRNVLGAPFVVAITAQGSGPLAFDVGRCAQNMLLAAWNEGVVSSPNGIRDPERTGELLGVGEGERAVIVLTFGYPVAPRNPEARSAEEWSRRANRRPLDEVVRRL